MRSYIYSNGSLHPCQDSLPATAPTLVGERAARSAYRTALDKLGFPESYDTFTSRLGEVKVYGRDHSILSADRKENEVYDFLCVLYVGRSYIRVWINDFPSLLQFFHEIDAKEEDELSKTVQRFLKKSSLEEMLANFSAALSDMYLGNLEVTVKAPKPPTRKG